jgi:hypothetical protein
MKSLDELKKERKKELVEDDETIRKDEKNYFSSIGFGVLGSLGGVGVGFAIGFVLGLIIQIGGCIANPDEPTRLDNIGIIVLFASTIIGGVIGYVSGFSGNREKKYSLKSIDEEFEQKERGITGNQIAIIVVIAILFLTGMGYYFNSLPSKRTNQFQNKSDNLSDSNIGIESFTPAEINEYFGEGVGCEYSNEKGEGILESGRPICLEAWTNGIMVMKINQGIVKLKQIDKNTVDERNKKYSGENFEVSLHIETIEQLEHVTKNTGYLIITRKDGNRYKVQVWGGCGD